MRVESIRLASLRFVRPLLSFPSALRTRSVERRAHAQSKCGGLRTARFRDGPIGCRQRQKSEPGGRLARRKQKKRNKETANGSIDEHQCSIDNEIGVVFKVCALKWSGNETLELVCESNFFLVLFQSAERASECECECNRSIFEPIWLPAASVASSATHCH